MILCLIFPGYPTQCLLQITACMIIVPVEMCLCSFSTAPVSRANSFVLLMSTSSCRARTVKCMRLCTWPRVYEPRARSTTKLVGHCVCVVMGGSRAPQLFRPRRLERGGEEGMQSPARDAKIPVRLPLLRVRVRCRDCGVCVRACDCVCAYSLAIVCI